MKNRVKITVVLFIMALLLLASACGRASDPAPVETKPDSVDDGRNEVAITESP